jgi:hypothetical protein
VHGKNDSLSQHSSKRDRSRSVLKQQHQSKGLKVENPAHRLRENLSRDLRIRNLKKQHQFIKKYSQQRADIQAVKDYLKIASNNTNLDAGLKMKISKFTTNMDKNLLSHNDWSQINALMKHLEGVEPPPNLELYSSQPSKGNKLQQSQEPSRRSTGRHK